jgi:hypothetical protein
MTVPVRATQSASPQPFHWQQIESGDYRQYIANLRAIGCPERLIRDVILADVAELYYSTRRALIQRPLFPPWTGADQRQASFLANSQQDQALQQEQLAVTEQLLGYPWSFQGKEMLRDGYAGMLLSHLTTDLSWQVLELFDLYQDQARWVRRRTQGILLAEDRAELAALADGLKSQLTAMLTPTQLDELLLRVQWGVTGDQRHFELANLTGTELRQIVHLHRQHVDGIAEVVIEVSTPSAAELHRRELEFDSDVLALLGPEKLNDLKRAGDDRFHEIVEFTQPLQLPRQTAVAAYEIRVAAEEEARRATTDLDPSELHARLETIRETTATALTQLLSPAHMREYLTRSGHWLEELGPPTAAEPEEDP